VPRVLVGVPTYNRAPTLERAVRSILEQTHADLQLVISDNASTDATEELCRSLAAADDRIRYVRHPVNRGPTPNFNWLFEELGRGEYAQLLADDDWLDPRYLERCLAELVERPDHALVGGRPRWHRGGRAIGFGRLLQIPQESPRERVRAYLRGVEDNGTFYSLMRGAALRTAGPMPNTLGNDWFHVAARVWSGKARMLDDVHVNREVGGTSDTIDEILETFGGATGLARYAPYVAIACGAFAELGWRGEAYASAGPPWSPARLALAARTAPAAIRWRYSVWHPVRAPVLRLRRRPRAREAVDRILRLFGGAPPEERIP
jgi:glycosyltransferase involved in cell wall biosynthesis